MGDTISDIGSGIWGLKNCMSDDNQIFVSEEINEKEWLKGVSKNDVFEFLNNEVEDIYSLKDGNSLKQIPAVSHRENDNV